MKDTCFVACCSPEYLTRYIVLYNSIQKHIPNVDTILYYGGDVNPSGIGQVINIQSWLQNTNYPDNKLYQYCTVRPKAILDAFNKGYKYVWLLGCDTEFFSDPSDVMYDLWDNDACVSMYSFEPYPAESPHAFANDLSNLENGQINADFIGFRKSDQVIKFLQWVEKQTTTKCVINGKEFVDQVWMSMGFSYLNQVHVIRHNGVNVQHCNMFQRNMRQINGKWILGDADPLVLFHYAGFIKGQEERISKHQNRYKASGEILTFLKDYGNKI